MPVSPSGPRTAFAPWIARLWLAALFLLLFANFRFNVFCTVPQEAFRVFQADSQALAEQKLFEIAASGKLDPARGFLVRSKEMEKQRLAGAYPEATPQDGAIYRSQFGLQGLLGSLVQWVLRTPAPVTISLLETLMALGTAGVLVALLHVLQKRHGLLVSGVAAVPFLFNPTLVLAGRNLYWILPFIMLPLVATWMLYESRGIQKSTLRLAFPLVAVLVMVKCLCGYEYITCLCLGPAVALTAVWAAGGFRDFPAFFKHCAILFAAACLGFAVAIVLHFVFVWWAVGSLPDAVASIFARATQHIAATESQAAPLKYQHGVVGFVLMIIKYLTFPGVFVGAQVPFGEFNYNLLSASFAGMFLFGFLFSLSRVRTLRDWPLAAGPLLVITAGLLASVSWLVAARGHSLNHFHLNSMAFLPLILSFPLSLFAAGPGKRPDSTANPDDKEEEP